MTPREYAELFAPALASFVQDRDGLHAKRVSDRWYSVAVSAWAMPDRVYPLLRAAANRILRKARGRRIVLERGADWYYAEA